MSLSKILRAFAHTIAWTMEEPPAYGLLHLAFTVGGFILSWYGARKLRGINAKNANLLFLSVGFILFTCEMCKQLLCYFVINQETYNWNDFPFQLCSIPMYLCIALPFVKSDKLQRSLYTFMMCFNLLGGAISFAEPSGLLHSYVFLTAHSLLWHMALVFIGLYIAFSGKGGFCDSDYIGAVKFFVSLCAVAFLFNLAIQNLTGDDVNMFFIGPGNSPIIVFKQIAESTAWYIGTFFYIPCVCIGAYIVFCLLQRLHKRTISTERMKS